MNNWDFGFSGPPPGHPGPPQPDEADGPWESPDAAPYPLTYERGRPEPPPAPSHEPWPPTQVPGAQVPGAQVPGSQVPGGQVPADAFAGGAVSGAQADPGPFAGDPWPQAATRAWPGPLAEDGTGGQFSDDFDGQSGGGPAGGQSGDQFRDAFGDDFDGQPWPPRNPRRGGYGWGGSGRRWLIPAGITVAAAAIGAAVVLFAGGHPKTPATAAPAAPKTPTAPKTPAAPKRAAGSAAHPPLGKAQAKGVVAGYTTANNSANAQRSDAQLAMIETGSSYAIDAGIYRVQQAAGVAPYPAFGPLKAAYYIPRTEPASGPRWFVVRVANAFFSTPGKVSATEYLLFTQATPGGPWENAVEPYLLPGATAPRIAVGRDGLATAVSTAATSLTVAPGQLAARTAASLDGTGQGGTAAVTVPGSLADQSDQRFWHKKLPAAAVTDTHAAAAGADGQTFALRTVGGGALVFYTDTAELQIIPPAGTMLHLTVPGLYSPAQALTRAGLAYLDQFAAYDPPAGSGAPRVVAGYSGLTGKN